MKKNTQGLNLSYYFFWLQKVVERSKNVAVGEHFQRELCQLPNGGVVSFVLELFAEYLVVFFQRARLCENEEREDLCRKTLAVSENAVEEREVGENVIDQVVLFVVLYDPFLVRN